MADAAASGGRGSAARAGTAASLRFTKMHGAGNDFVVIDLRGGTPEPDAPLCRALADRHGGVGCDQILTIEAPRSAEAIASYRIWNADGSAAGQCGNGARCVAAWVVRDAQAQDRAIGDHFLLDSPAGTHAVERVGAGRYRVAMGVPLFAPDNIPLLGVDGEADTYSVRNGENDYAFGAVSMGNPHAVIEVDDATAARVARLGPRLQSLPAFPEGVNVGFAQVESRRRIRLRVYERGVGETLACGSGACAAAVVLIRRGKVDREVTVALPGGELEIAWPRDDAPVTMSGPAAFVFEGEWIGGQGG